MSGKLTLISSVTASSSSSVEFTSGIDSTYDEYVFYFVDIHPATDASMFSFQVNASGGSGYNETITSTIFGGNHKEDDSAAYLGYWTDQDQAQGTNYQVIASNQSNASDSSAAGVLHLFSPSSTSKVKHFYSRINDMNSNGYQSDEFAAGYINTTSAITEISFKFTSGNFDANIYFFGVS